MEKKEQETNESVNDLYTRVRSKYYKTFRHIAMQVRLADEVVKEVGCRPNNIIGQQTAAATVVIRGHKIIDASRAKETSDKLIDISNLNLKDGDKIKVERKTAV